jgi:hypothetical protein
MQDTHFIDQMSDKQIAGAAPSLMPDWLGQAVTSAYEGTKTVLQNPYVDGALVLGVAAIAARGEIAPAARALFKGAADIFSRFGEGGALAPQAVSAAALKSPTISFISLGGPIPENLAAKYGAAALREGSVSFSSLFPTTERPLTRVLSSSMEGGRSVPDAAMRAATTKGWRAYRTGLAARIADMSTADGENMLRAPIFNSAGKAADGLPSLRSIIPTEISWGPKLP